MARVVSRDRRRAGIGGLSSIGWLRHGEMNRPFGWVRAERAGMRRAQRNRPLRATLVEPPDQCRHARQCRQPQGQIVSAGGVEVLPDPRPPEPKNPPPECDIEARHEGRHDHAQGEMRQEPAQPDGRHQPVADQESQQRSGDGTELDRQCFADPWGEPDSARDAIQRFRARQGEAKRKNADGF